MGTLDSLVALSDDLAKLDNYIEGYKSICFISNHVIACFRVTKKLIQYFFHDVLDDDRNRLAENLSVGPQGGMCSVSDLKTHFAILQCS